MLAYGGDVVSEREATVFSSDRGLTGTCFLDEGLPARRAARWLSVPGAAPGSRTPHTGSASPEARPAHVPLE